MDRLYRKRFHREPYENVVDSTCVFKRVESKCLDAFKSKWTKKDKLKGDSVPFSGKNWDVYPLGKQKQIHGYMLNFRSQEIYFEFEKKGDNRGEMGN